MLNKQLLQELREYVEKHIEDFAMVCYEPKYSEDLQLENMYSLELEAFIEENRKPSLRDVLFHFIDRSGASDPAIYKKAGIDRRHFAKIRSNPNYTPKKHTVIALAFALELDRKDADTLLEAAGYSLSSSDTFDLVVQFCFEKRIHNIDEVNEALGQFELKPLLG